MAPAAVHLAQLGIVATNAVARHIAAEIQRGRLPAGLLVHGNFRYAVLSDSISPPPAGRASGGIRQPPRPSRVPVEPTRPVRDRR